jgi:hypothetical protein
VTIRWAKQRWRELKEKIVVYGTIWLDFTAKRCVIPSPLICCTSQYAYSSTISSTGGFLFCLNHSPLCNTEKWTRSHVSNFSTPALGKSFLPQPQSQDDLPSGKVALAHPSNRTTALSFIQPCPLGRWSAQWQWLSVNHLLSIDCGKCPDKGGRQKYRALNLRPTTPIRNSVLDFGWALQSSFQLQSHAGQLRQNWGQRWQPPQQIQRLSDDQISALAITKRYS